MALLNIEGDPWLIEHESCEKLHRDIMEQLSLRQRETRTSDNFAKISANIRIRMKQFANELNQLRQKLEISTRTGAITFEESERRNRQIEVLQSKKLRMQRLFDEPLMQIDQDRSQLLGSTSWGETRRENETVGDVLTDQKRMLGEQEQGLENLSKIISRQKNIAQAISSEVDLHNDILEDLGDHIERTDMRVRNETQNVTVVDAKDKTCIYWVIIILLFISIIVVVAI